MLAGATWAGLSISETAADLLEVSITSIFTESGSETGNMNGRSLNENALSMSEVIV